MSAKPRLGVLHVGVANRGKWSLEKCDADSGFAPAALCDVSSAALAEARQLTGLPESACYSDLAKALTHPGVDCVIICTPTKYHAPQLELAVSAGKPVLVEKGMAPDWATAQAMARSVRLAGAVACISQNYRYWGAERTLLRCLCDTASPYYIGPVHFGMYTHLRVRPEPRTLNYPFAAVWDMSCHHFDSLLAWLGPVAALTGQAWRAEWSKYEHPTNTTGHLEFASGARIHYVHIHDAARTALDIQFHGERGAVSLSDNKILFSPRPLEQFASRPMVEVPHEPGEGEKDVLRDFHRYITTGVEPGISVANNLETMAMCEMMARSVTFGRRVLREELT